MLGCAIMGPGVRATLVLAFWIPQSFNCALADDSAATAFEQLKPSLAIAQSESGAAEAKGTAFCIASDSGRSYFLTSNHVLIGDNVTLRLEIDRRTYRARVVRRSVLMDVAIVEVDRGDVPAVVLSAVLPEPGTLIAVAGYPSFHLTSDLEPSVHLGAINSIMDGGATLEHDALTDHGNSGGPLFDRDTGVVYGINSALYRSQTSSGIVNFTAVAIPYVMPFLDNARIAYSSAGQEHSTSGAVLADVPGSFRVAYVAPDASQAGAEPIKESADTHISAELASMLGSHLVLVPLSSLDPTESMEVASGQLCRDQRVNAIALVGYWWSGQAEASAFHVTADFEMVLSDCYTEGIGSGQGHKETDFPPSTNLADIQADYTTALDQAADQALNQLNASIAANPTIFLNLVRYGVGIATGHRSAGLVLLAGKAGAVVSSISTIGTAASAGISRLDTIVALNGESLAGLSQDQLAAVIARTESTGGTYEARVLRADGKTVVVRYRSEDIAWYLKKAESYIPSQRHISGAQNAALAQSIGGTYTGLAHDVNAGRGQLQLTISESQGSLSGSWGITFENTSFDNSGTVSGSATGSAITLTLKPLSGGACTLTLIGSLENGIIGGTYGTQGCATGTNGSFEVRHQEASIPVVAGAYKGTIADNSAGPGTFTVTIYQNGTNLSGTWTASFADKRRNNSGTVNGILVNGTTAQFDLTSSVPGACVYLATATVQQGSMTGTYTAQSCTLANGGSFTATSH